MNKKTLRNVTVVAVAIVIFIAMMGSGTLVPKNPYINKVFSSKNFISFSTIPQQSPIINCQTDNSLYYVDTNGKTNTVDDTHRSIIPYFGLQGLDISAYATGNRISTVGGTLTLSCNKIADVLQLQLLLAGKFVTLTLSGLNSKGQSVPVYTTTSQITTQQDINGKSILVMKWTEPASAIYSALQDPTSQYTSWLTAHYDYEFDFIHGTDPNKFPLWRYPDLAGNTDESIFRVLIQNPTPTSGSAPILGQDVKLTLNSPSDGNIDLTKSNRFFQVTATLSNWHPAEDYPIMELFKASDDIRTANPFYIWKLTTSNTYSTLIGSATDFTFSFNLPNTMAVGDYKLFLQSAIDSTGTLKRTGTDVAILHLIKPAPPVCTADQLSAGYTNVNGVCTAPAPTNGNGSSGQVCTAAETKAGYTNVNGICTAPSGFNLGQMFTDFTTCVQGGGNYSCLNNSEFIPIYLVVLILVVIGIASGRKQS
jgi:hypothetical protein